MTTQMLPVSERGNGDHAKGVEITRLPTIKQHMVPRKIKNKRESTSISQADQPNKRIGETGNGVDVRFLTRQGRKGGRSSRLSNRTISREEMQLGKIEIFVM